MIAWTIFYNPVERFSDLGQLLMMVPLLVAVAVVYKAIRTRNVRRLHVETLGLIGYMVGGLTVLGVVLWGIQRFWP